MAVSSGSEDGAHLSRESGGPPALESSSSSESLATFRNVIAAENEAEIYVRIRNLENLQYYNLPPQNNQGEYEQIVRDNFNQALDVEHYRQIMDSEYFDLRVLEQKGFLQEKLHSLMLEEDRLSRILELSPYSDIRKEAFHFLQDKLEPLEDLRYPFQKHLMEGSLSFFRQQLEQHGRQSEIYREFYEHFSDQHFRRLLGLPLP
ncbi:hypothetical protein MLD38_014779 [Melastoma candidum]|uniref:Uncharacterized protein n=1 Tax=Melastoma candidum TaxID=119954 RepID=A0ACB9RF23_9MYRT|nr:hypothetical protein MLD38_014779 [Melastoma candidum]